MKKINFSKFNQKGFGLIEAVVGIIVALIIILSFTALITRAVTYSSINGKQLRATLYLQEMIEAAKDLEQSPDGWDRLTTTTSPCYATCYLYVSGSSWDINPATEWVENNIYERWMEIEDVCRDAGNNIVDCIIGADDPNTKKVTAYIDWNDRLGSQRLELEAYLYNFNP